MDKLIAPAVFIVCYVLFAALPRRRHWVGLAGMAAVLLLDTFGLGIGLREAFVNTAAAGSEEAARPAVNWNVMGIFVGTLVVAEMFMKSGMPAHLADRIIRRAPSARVALLAICLMTSFISAFVENVAAVLIIAPVALAITNRLGIRPVPFFTALAVSSNLQGCATLIGDPPSMLLGAAGNMTFNEFIWMDGRPSIFFAVQLGAATSFLVLMVVFWRHRQPVHVEEVIPVRTRVPTYLMIALIAALALSSVVDPGFGYMAGIVCMSFAVLAMLWEALFHRSDMWTFVKQLDWPTTIFLLSVFVLVGALKEQGVLTHLAGWIGGITGGSLLVTFIVLIGIAMVISAFVDNVPFLIAMIPVTLELNAQFGYTLDDPAAYVLLFGLLIGASLGGNISPIGAAANIVSMGIMERRGFQPRFWEFVRIGLPFTLIATATGALFIWLVWH